ncbi:hypothetical protein SFC43_22200 [Bacteroides sp. CR5/BHMF/2]|nr:hypothetical protein [Bacteroides sp. CR5/BHMF/2]
MIPGKIVKYEKGKHLKEIYSNVQKIYLLLLVALCGAMITPAVAKKKSKKKLQQKLRQKEREKRNQV